MYTMMTRHLNFGFLFNVRHEIRFVRVHLRCTDGTLPVDYTRYQMASDIHELTIGAHTHTHVTQKASQSMPCLKRFQNVLVNRIRQCQRILLLQSIECTFTCVCVCECVPRVYVDIICLSISTFWNL